MIRRELIAFALESAIGAELALFAGFLLSSPRRRSPALYLLAGLALGLAAMMAGNLLIGGAGWDRLADAVLFLDLLVPPTIYLYVTQIRSPARALRRSDWLHATPAVAGMLAWETGLLASMDAYVNACWFGYLLVALYYFRKHYRDYAPAPRQRFLIALFGLLLAIGVLRLIIVFDVGEQPDFRDGVPYLLILAGMFLVTCQILFTALRHPDLLSVPGSHLKYALSTVDDAALDDLDRRLAAILDERRPYLDPDFSLAALAALLNAPPRHVSQLVNTRHAMNFAAYMNSLRARTAAALLDAAPERPIKIVMFEAGFRAKSVFNREFQRHLGMSPSVWRNRAAAAQNDRTAGPKNPSSP